MQRPSTTQPPLLLTLQGRLPFKSRHFGSWTDKFRVETSTELAVLGPGQSLPGRTITFHHKSSDSLTTRPLSFVVMKRHIALVEDHDDIRANYTDLLRRAGFAVDPYGTKDEALRGLAERVPDLVLLDITLHSEQDAGFEICAELRRRSASLPIVFLTSHADEADKISGLRVGADDYITKDASMAYLIVRLEALFRRHDAQIQILGQQSPAPPDTVRNDREVVFDDVTSRAMWRGARIDLPLTQYWMLRDLCRHAGKPRTHAELMSAAHVVVEPNTVTAHIKAIRDEFCRRDPSFDQIRTERGRGYRWVPA
jgi:two-component system OmpR family response regulator